ncbi:MAG: hypothetical protein M0R74_20645 [Dehalococcoidia bacterium]|jgi:hypothetical protein|nr:hypothetical protein [Dehalococcoidia bacterium]
MKTTRLFIRVSDDERGMVEKASREHKSLSAFVLWSVRTVWKYRKLIELAARIESGGLSPVKLLEAAARQELKNMVRK